MKKILTTAAVLLTISASAEARDATKGPYLRLDTGASLSRDAGKDLQADVGNAAIVGAGAGYRFNQHVRGDVTLGYRGGYGLDTTVDSVGYKGDVSSLTGMANAYVDVAKLGQFTPYVGGGVGFSRNTLSDLDLSYAGATGKIAGATTTSFAWQLSTGVGIEVAPKWTIDVGYRYVNLGETKTGTTGSYAGIPFSGTAASGDLTAHELQVGVRYAF